MIANRHLISNLPSDRTAPAMAAESDRTLTLRAQTGDSAALLALLDRYAAPLYNLALRTTGDAAGSAEVVTDVLANRLRALSECNPSPPGEGGPQGPGEGLMPQTSRSTEKRRPVENSERFIVPLAADLYRALLDADFRPERRTAGLRISPRHWNASLLRIADGQGRGGRRTAQRLRRRLAHAWSLLAMQQRFVLTLTETQNLSPAELARVLGLSESAARNLRDEAKLALLALLARPQRRSWLRRNRNDEDQP